MMAKAKCIILTQRNQAEIYIKKIEIKIKITLQKQKKMKIETNC